jgi:non-ribosomal peptide synthetase component E (peptide arylation enzyme)
MHFVQGDDPKFDDVAFARSMCDRIPSIAFIVQARGPARESALSMRTLIDGMSRTKAMTWLAQVPQDPFQVAVFQLSGGTTGVPKIIPRFHHEYLYNMRAVAEFMGYTPDDRIFVPMPMMHNLNMGACFGPFLLTGGMLAVAADLTPQAMAQVFKLFKPTWTVMGGPIVEKLRPAIASGELPVDHLRGVISANNAPSLRELLGCTVHHVFGMTEGVMMFTQANDPMEVQDTMHGRPISTKDRVKIFQVGTEIEINEPGVEGECAFFGPYTIHGYYAAEERNKETFTSHGYYRSGDLMSFQDIQGKRYYQFRGRTKDVVDRAGEKVNCEEVELLLNRHPKVFTSAVVGMPDPVYGERICAFMTLTDASQTPTVAEIGDFLKSLGLAKFKWPERIEPVSELPLTKAGKLNKPALKEWIQQKLKAERADS